MGHQNRYGHVVEHRFRHTAPYGFNPLAVAASVYDDEVSVHMRGSRQKEIAHIDVSRHEGPSVRTGAMTHQVETERHEVAHIFCLLRVC
jgi:hypothetical protein